MHISGHGYGLVDRSVGRSVDRRERREGGTDLVADDDVCKDERAKLHRVVGQPQEVHELVRVVDLWGVVMWVESRPRGSTPVGVSAQSRRTLLAMNINGSLRDRIDRSDCDMQIMMSPSVSRTYGAGYTMQAPGGRKGSGSPERLNPRICPTPHHKTLSHTYTHACSTVKRTCRASSMPISADPRPPTWFLPCVPLVPGLMMECGSNDRPSAFDDRWTDGKRERPAAYLRAQIGIERDEGSAWMPEFGSSRVLPRPPQAMANRVRGTGQKDGRRPFEVWKEDDVRKFEVRRPSEDQRNNEQRLSARKFDEASMPRRCPCLASHQQQRSPRLAPPTRSIDRKRGLCLPAGVRATCHHLGYQLSTQAPTKPSILLASYAATPTSSSMAQDDTVPTATTDPTTSPVAAASAEAPAADDGMPPTEEQYFEVCSSCMCRGIGLDRSMRAWHADI